MDTRLIGIVVFVVAPFLVLLGGIALFPKWCRRLGWFKQNYRGATVPCSYGVIWWAFCTVLYGELFWVSDEEAQALTLAYTISAFGYGALGLVDDLWGGTEEKGIRGHLRALFRGKVTTGLIKAVGGLTVGMAAAFLLYAGWAAIIAGLIIALAANTMNLLDMRPGRAVTVFLFLSVATVTCLLWRQQSLAAALLGFLMAAGLLLRRRDAAGEAMMGDVGSNLLGGVLGLAMVVALWLWAQIVLLVLLIALHIATERGSLSQWIERTPWAQRLDRLTGVR